MNNYKFINNVTGWSVFLISAVTYILTIESTVSFWDCGEFITSAYKLEVGHPPGAPIFMLIGKIFTLFSFGNKEAVPVTINILSALSSAFTILFLFWSITHIARRIIVKKLEELSLNQTLLVMGTGVVGALAYTFSDTFWFSAVEGEVYAMSSLFTAVVFWAILKWESQADEKYANRWIILIAYLMGLSIGVHLLNLLALPAIVFIYYLKKYTPTVKGIIAASGIAIALLGGIMYLIIPGVIWGASKFELLFTNSFGLPFNTGSIIYFILLIGGICFGIYYSVKKQKVILNTILLGITVILIGYTSFATIIIRSVENPPMNQNHPDNLFALQSYLNREQYGDRPLFRGEYFNAPVLEYKKGKAIYTKGEDKYIVTNHKIEREFDSDYITTFPRMYSNQLNHPQGYAFWTGIKDNETPPSFSQNLQFFFKYQIRYMYNRYFLWNFVGRQNDIQGHNKHLTNGNWISGIPFIDNLRLGDQSKLPDYLKENPGRNKYYFLPLILAIIGIIFLYRINKNARNYLWVLLLFFFFTGYAIIIYLNQPPFQPRERDYAYAGSFYVFSMFIGFGVLGIYELIKKYLNNISGVAISVIIPLLAAPVLMAFENWDDHDRSGRYSARDFATNYLNSCAPNAILFTNGDNDTFPLWYAQEVEGIRTDVRIINLSYLNTDWYINQMRKQAYDSKPVPFSLDKEKYRDGTRDIIYHQDIPNIFLNERYQSSKKEYYQQYDSLFNELLNIIEQSNFTKLQSSDYATLKKGSNAILPVQFSGLVNKLSENASIKKFNLDSKTITDLKKSTDSFINQLNDEHLPIDLFMRFITNDSPQFKVTLGTDQENFMPTRKVKMKVDKKAVLTNNVVAEKDTALILDELEFTVPRTHLRKAELMVLDLIRTNNWKRPIYFAITVGSDNYLNLDQYFQLDGMAYRLVPIKSSNKAMERGRVNSDILYDALMKKFKWGNITDENVYLDENNLRMLMNMKNNFARLAETLINENKKDSAKQVLSRVQEIMPPNRIPYSYYNLLLAEQYYRLDDFENGNKMIKELSKITEQELEFFFSLEDDQYQLVLEDAQRSIAIAQESVRIIRSFGQKELDVELSTRFLAQLRKINVIGQADNLQGDENQFYQWYARLTPENQQLISVYVFFMQSMQSLVPEGME